MVIRIRQTPQGFLLPVRVTPRSAFDRLLPFAPEDTWVQAQVRVPPEDGKANAAVIEVLSEACGIPKRDIDITNGHTSRLKTFLVATGDIHGVLDRLADGMESRTDACFELGGSDGR